jgi:hypothetical protein
MSSWPRTLWLPTTAAVAAAMLVGCTGGSDPSRVSERPTATATALANATCVTLEHEDQRLGVTVPAGFTVTTPPDNAAELADVYRVNLLSLAQRKEFEATPPTAMLAVYGYGRDEREGQSALEATVLNFTGITGGVNQANPISATPTTVAGARGAAGSRTDSRALDSNPPDATLRWWMVPTDDGLFIVTLATATPDLDARYSTEVPTGLTPGGC